MSDQGYSFSIDFELDPSDEEDFETLKTLFPEHVYEAEIFGEETEVFINPF